jgi:hypothetical protein
MVTLSSLFRLTTSTTMRASASPACATPHPSTVPSRHSHHAIAPPRSRRAHAPIRRLVRLAVLVARGRPRRRARALIVRSYTDQAPNHTQPNDSIPSRSETRFEDVRSPPCDRTTTRHVCVCSWLVAEVAQYNSYPTGLDPLTQDGGLSWITAPSMRLPPAPPLLAAPDTPGIK